MRPIRGSGLLVLVAFAACADLKSAPDPATSSDGGTSSSSSSASSGSTSGGPTLTDAGVDPDSGLLPPEPDSGVHPSDPCRPTPAACMDSSPVSVIEVPTEATLEEARLLAKPLDVIQLRGGTDNSGITLPKDVSLNGCESAVMTGQIVLGGGTQTVSNLILSGTVFVGKTGSFNFTRDRFTKTFVTTETRAGLLISTKGAPLDTTMSVAINDSSFVGRARGIDVYTNVQASVEGVQVTVNNGVFSRVPAPITMTEEGRRIRGTITSSTFYDFGTAIVLDNLAAGTADVEVTSSLFAKGFAAIDGKANHSAYRWNYSFAWNVTTPLATPATGVPTLSTNIDPAFVDAEKDDLRLSAGSLAVNRIPAILVLPETDFIGCKRPVALGSDPGAFESQP